MKEYFKENYKKFISEFLGTLFLVLIGCGTAVVVGCATPAGILCTALAFGLTLAIMAYIFGNVSGCHVNPAVTIAFLALGKIKFKEAVGYIVSQFIGAISGAAILGVLVKSFKTLGANSYGNSLFNGETVTVCTAIIIEVILTFIFVLSVIAVTDKNENKAIAGLIIGLSLFLVHIIGIRFTGTSVNPARSFGPALLEGGKPLSQYFVFLFSPLIGGILSSLTFKYLIKKK